MNEKEIERVSQQDREREGKTLDGDLDAETAQAHVYEQPHVL